MHRWGSTRCKAVKNVVNCRVRLNLKSEKGRKKEKLREVKEEAPDVGRMGSDCVPKFLQGKRGKVKSSGNVFWELQRGWIRDSVFWRHILPMRFICWGKLEAHPSKPPSQLHRAEGCLDAGLCPDWTREAERDGGMLPGPAHRAGLCRAMSAPSAPHWWGVSQHLCLEGGTPGLGRFQAAPEMKAAEVSPLAFSTAPVSCMKVKVIGSLSLTSLFNTAVIPFLPSCVLLSS